MRMIGLFAMCVLLEACTMMPMFPPEVMKNVETNTFDVEAWQAQTYRPSNAGFVPHKVELGGEIIEVIRKPEGVVLLVEEQPIENHPAYGSKSVERGDTFWYAIAFNGSPESSMLRRGNKLVVVSPLKGSPAEAAGVRTGDAILFINGSSTENMGVDKAVSLIRGPRGTPVKISFLPVGAGKPVDRTIVRDTIKIPTIDVSEKPGGIFVIKLYSFTADSPGLFRDALRRFVLSGYRRLVLDLRGNPGGYLDAAWDMASWFLPAGKVIVTEDFGGKAEAVVFRSKGYDIFNDSLRMMILVDGGSASAAEILAGALSQQGRAELVGSKTFGKGSVQELVAVTPDTSLKVTVARWLTPNGTNLSHEGLVPKYAATTTEADIVAGRDPVLDKAVTLMQGMP